MPNVRSNYRVVAILTSDWHLSEKPPIARSCEKDWFEAMLRPINEIKELSVDNNCCPIIVAGDIFDKHNPSPRLINWAMDNLPPICSVAGQHDLKHHNLNDLEYTAYYTLMRAGRISHLAHNEYGAIVNTEDDGRVTAYGFSWGEEVKPPARKYDGIKLAVIHKYIWVHDKGHPGAAKEAHCKEQKKGLKGYDVALFGDNHIQFVVHGKPTIVNCGSLMRRNIDQVNHRPAVGLLFADGTVELHHLDCSEDKFIDIDEDEASAVGIDANEFIKELGELSAAAVNFSDAIKRWCSDNNVSKSVKKLLTEIMEESK